MVDYIIPEMSVKAAIHYLQQHEKVFKKNTQSLDILKDYCIFKIAKYLPDILRMNRKDLDEIGKMQHAKIVQRSIEYLRGG